MALIKCPECEKDISDQTSKCVHCGYQLKVMPEKTSQFVRLIIAICIIGTLICFSGYKYVQYQNEETKKQQEIDQAVEKFNKTLEQYNKANGFK